MILRKPYAFLIKHFKIIHLILSTLLIFLFFKFFNIFDFFNTFINNGYLSYIPNIASNYINSYIYIFDFVALIILSIVYILMKKKNKATKIYLFSLIYYAILFVLTIWTYGILESYETSIIKATYARFYRDFSLLVLIPQIYFIIFFILRGIGFNIKKFNFSKDIADMKIHDIDREEFEVDLSDQTYKVSRSFRKTIRELNYYLKENKYIFIIFIIIGVISLGSYTFLNKEQYEFKASEKETVSTSHFNIKVMESLITNTDYKGDVIDKDYYFLVLNMELFNKLSINYKLDISNYRLLINNKYYYSITNYNEFFIDLGAPYRNTKLEKNTAVNKLLIFKIPVKEKTDNYTLRIVNDLNYAKDNIKVKYTDVRLNIKKLITSTDEKSYSLKEEVSLSNSIIDSVKLSINNYILGNEYLYKINSCLEDYCYDISKIIKADSNQNAVMAINYNLDYKNEVYFDNIKNNNKFFVNFGKISYTINGVEKETLINVKNIKGLDNTIVFEVLKEVKNANNIRLELTIRNSNYKIILK